MPVKPSYEELENRVAQLEARLDAYRNSEERFNKRKVESLFRSAPTGIGVVRDRVITQANLKLQEITGYSEQELLGQSSRMLYPTDGDYAYVGKEKYRQIDLHGTGTVETRWRRKDGKIIDVLLSSTPIDLEDYTLGVTFTALDISERKKIERSLNFQALLLDQIHDHVTATDLDGNILYVNEAEIKSTGRTREELLDESVHVYGEDPARGATQDEIIRKTLTKGAWRGEVVNYAADGREITMDCRTRLIRDGEGNPWRMLGISTDITERKRSESERELLLTAIEQSPDAVVITDSDAKIQYVNGAFETLTGYGREQLVGRNPRLLKSGKHDKAFYKSIWEQIGSGRAWKGNITNRKKDGSFFTEETSISPVHDSSGRIVNYVAVKRDITGELELKRQLAQSQKMETIGTLAGGIAHDFNNILSPIIGHTEILLEELQTVGAPAKESLEQIYASALRARDLVKQILTYSRSQKTEYRPLMIHLILKECIQLIRSTIPRSVDIRTDIDRACPAVNADPTQMHQMIMNLLTNGFHALEDDCGQLSVSLNETDILDLPGNVLSGNETAQGPFVRLEVADTGVGIPPDIREKIFDPFFTTKELGKGTGMGLSVVHGIVENMGGHIHVKSTPGKGSRFILYLPTAQPIAMDENPNPPGNGEWAGRESILLVDDEDAILKMMTRSLEPQGYSVTAFSGAREALAHFKETPNAFDLVITDMAMPGMQGDTLAGEILSIRPDISVVLCTGFSARLTPGRVKALGVKEVMIKPIVLKDLKQKIRKILDER